MSKRVAVFGEDRVVMALLGGSGVGVRSADLKAADYDALVLTTADAPAALIRAFYSAERPIAAFGPAVAPVAANIPRVTVCKGTPEVAGAHYEDCADDDFVSDREHRVISAPWPVASALRELVEMA